MAEVALPDGTVIPVPDEVLGIKPAPARAGPPGITEDIGTRAVPRMLARGIFSLPDLGVAALKAAGTFPEYKSPIPGYAPTAETPSPTIQAVKDYMARVKSPSESMIEAAGVPKPETGAGKYAEEIGSGAIGALSFPGSVVPKVVAGMGGGFGGELAAHMVGDTPASRVAGALAGATAAYPALSAVKLGASFLGGPSVNTPKIVSDAAKGTTPAEFDAMAAGQKAGRDLGVETTPIQNLERPSALHGLQEKVTAASPELQAELAKQNPAAAKAGLFFLDKIAPPGEPATVATRAQGAAEGAIEKSRKFTTTVTKPYYEILHPDVPYSLMRETAAKMKGIVQESPAAREFLKEEVLSKITRPSKTYSGEKGWMYDAGAIPGEPLYTYKGGMAGIIERETAQGIVYDLVVPGAKTPKAIATGKDPEVLQKIAEQQFGGKSTGLVSVEEVKNVLNEAKTKLNAPNIGDRGIDRYVAGKIGAALDEMEQIVSGASANRPLGHQIYAEMYDRIINPMRQSLTGKIAGVKGVVDEAVPPTTRILNELNAPTVRAESIHKLATDMKRGGDPQAFPALVRATWEQNLEKAFGGAGGAAPNAPAKFASALWGTPEQAAKRENFRAAVAETARANGLSGREIDEAVVGAEKFAKVMEAAGRAKGGMGGAPGAGGGPVENILLRGGPGIQPAAQFRFFGQISDWLNQKAYGEIARALTSPEGMQELRKWAAFDLAKYRLSAVSGATAGVGQQGQER